MQRLFKFMFGAVIGGLAGSVTAILLAPSSGSALRETIQNRAQTFFTEIEEAGQQKRDELELELQELRSTD